VHADLPRYRLSNYHTPAWYSGGRNAAPPHSRATWQQDPAARRAIETLWRYDPDPAVTLAIQSQIDAAVAAGSVAARTSRGQRHYYCCP
jgi:hypothetical protein